MADLALAEGFGGLLGAAAKYCKPVLSLQSLLLDPNLLTAQTETL